MLARENRSITEVIVSLPNGLHARPTAQLVQLIDEYSECEIWITKGQIKADARSILDILSLMVQYGDRVTVEVVGGDSDLVLQKLYNFLSAVSS